MANPEQFEILKQGVQAWNQWRKENISVTIDLSGSNLAEANLEGANFNSVNLYRANFREANLMRTNFNRADVSAADLRKVNLSKASVRRAKLSNADLRKAVLRQVHFGKTDFLRADLRGADLSGSILEQAQFVNTKLQGANLSNCLIYGISAWGLDLSGANQQNLIITPSNQPVITVDNLEVAQFIYLLLNNEKIRSVIDTVARKAVLILGRFTPQRKAVLDAIREELRQRDYLPILFDFDKPATRDLTETVRTLAHLSCFVIADITNPRSIPQELIAIVESMPSVAVQPILRDGRKPWGMYDHIKNYPWVLPILRYRNKKSLLASLGDKIIATAEKKAKELDKR
jgi:hypothetical protein